jgi:hypothetical protein
MVLLIAQAHPTKTWVGCLFFSKPSIRRETTVNVDGRVYIRKQVIRDYSDL